MPNPMFNESTMRKASQTWAPPQPGTDYIPPITDGPVTPWRTGVMTVGGTISATAVLFGLLLVSATVRVDRGRRARPPSTARTPTSSPRSGWWASWSASRA